MMKLSRLKSKTMSLEHRNWLKAVVCDAGWNARIHTDWHGRITVLWTNGVKTVVGILNAARAAGIKFVPVE